MSIPHHFPSELLEQLVETIPRLIRGKQGVLDFFASAGVPSDVTADLQRKVSTNRDGITKFRITRTVLKRLNERGDALLRARREVVKRVVEWEDFSTCWESDRLEAKGLVAEIRRVVGVKDSFTRMRQARDKESQRHRKRYEDRAAAQQRKEAARATLRDRFAACFASTNPQRRGKELEGILNDYFREEGVAVREAFHVLGPENEGVVEQIDGAVELDGRNFLVEMKWWSQPLGFEKVSSFLVKVFTRGNCGGILIVHPRVTEPALTHFRDAIVKGATVFVVSLEDLYRLLESRSDLADYLRDRVRQAELQKRP